MVAADWCYRRDVLFILSIWAAWRGRVVGSRLNTSGHGGVDWKRTRDG